MITEKTALRHWGRYTRVKICHSPAPSRHAASRISFGIRRMVLVRMNTENGVKIYGDVELNPLLSRIISAGIVIKRVNCFESSIEDYYLSVTGGERHA